MNGGPGAQVTCQGHVASKQQRPDSSWVFTPKSGLFSLPSLGCVRPVLLTAPAFVLHSPAHAIIVSL